MAAKTAQNIFTVSKLTRKIKTLLEETYPFIWITGEISNYSVPGSGHSYFTLKDENAVISCVMFKNQKRNLKFMPENGMKVYGLSRLSLYEPRGAYQLIFEHMEPEGAGAIQLAFEQIKEKLKNKGYFEAVHKKNIPFFPGKVAVISSKTGAAIQDILNIAQRRFPGCRIDIIPVTVQGTDAADQICSAIDFIHHCVHADLIIIARGGGTLEDLNAFNSEKLAETIFNATIPVITGIGHETDFTIADFVADLRAPTPSAAAEMAFPDTRELLRSVLSFQSRLMMTISKQIAFLADKTQGFKQRLRSPEMMIFHARMSIEDMERRLNTSFLFGYEKYKRQYLQAASKLEILNPLGILNRGYSIVRTIPDKKLVMDARTIDAGDLVEIILSRGRLTTKVQETDGQTENI